nr:hypothetical protein TetV2_00406 [Oceanusvirus sp.]
MIETESLFEREHIHLMGTIPTEKEVRVATEALGGTPSDHEVRQYIVDMPEFHEKYSDLIRRIYTMSHEGAEPSDFVIRHYLNKFAYVPGYKPNDLADEIVSGDSRDIEEGEGDWEERESDAPEYHRTSIFSDPEQMMRFAAEWKRKTGVKMDVYEFIRYYGERVPSDDMEAVSRRQGDAMLRLDAETRTHLGRGVGRDEFLESYVFRYDRPEFDAEVMGTIMASDEYREAVTRRVEDEHDRLFGDQMHPDDAEYAFNDVRRRRIPLASEDISGVVIAVNDQLVEIHEGVRAVYRRVLQRDPDAEETREKVMVWRAEGQEACCRELEHELYESLEFHDVLKTEIRKKLEKRSQHVKPREVFDELSRVLRVSAGDMSKALEKL